MLDNGNRERWGLVEGIMDGLGELAFELVLAGVRAVVYLVLSLFDGW
jgi:hypothetical protein